MRSASEGAQNIIHAVLEDSQLIKVKFVVFRDIIFQDLQRFSKLQNGHFYRDFKLAEKENQKVDSLADISGRLWALSSELTDLN